MIKKIVLLFLFIILIGCASQPQAADKPGGNGTDAGSTKDEQDSEPTELTPDSCQIDAECVPAACCHPGAWVNINNKPNCEGIFCSMECAPETMDCGQGSCRCMNNKCTAIIS